MRKRKHAYYVCQKDSDNGVQVLLTTRYDIGAEALYYHMRKERGCEVASEILYLFPSCITDDGLRDAICARRSCLSCQLQMSLVWPD